MRELAESTGGFAVTNTNEIAAPMQRMMEDIRTHYELAYTPTSTNYDGHFRKIEVRVSRPKVTVQTRSGYFALPELNGIPLQPYELLALNAINAHPSPTGFPFRVALMKFRPSEQGVAYEVAFEVPVSGLKAVTNPKTGKTRIQASLVALIHNSSGDVVGKISREMAREVPSADFARNSNDRILYAEPVELPRGHYVVDAAVTDEQAGKTSVKRIAIFADPEKNFGMSSLAMVRQLQPLAGPRNPLDPFEVENERVVPTLADAVGSQQPVNLYFVVYPRAARARSDRPLCKCSMRAKRWRASRWICRSRTRTAPYPMLVHLSPVRDSAM